MRRLSALALVAWAACYSPRPAPGSPCDDGHPCPRPLVCSQGTSTCERSDIDAGGAEVDASDTCVPTGFDICGDGIDQDCSGGDAVCAANDKPAGAIDITTGGTFTGDLMLATDDLASKGCGGGGGRDVFYQITLDAPRVYYFDTFTSGFDTSVRVFLGKPCAQVTGAMAPVCNDDACGGAESMLATALPAGTSCVVVDQNANQTKGAFQLHVVPSDRTGTLLPMGPATLTGDTCDSTNVSNPTACMSKGGKDVGYYFAGCPGRTLHVDASTCTNTAAVHFDTVLYVRPNGGADLACDDDAAASVCMPRADRPDQADGSILSDVAVKGPGLFWLVVDGFDAGACGGYQLDTNLR